MNNEPPKSNRNPQTGMGTRIYVTQGALVYGVCDVGNAYQLKSGSIRLDHAIDGAISFAGLALPGDVIGAESLMTGRYCFSAKALADCELSIWPASPEMLEIDSILSALANSTRRSAEVVALRDGQAIDRIKKLIAMFTRAGVTDQPPALGDIADITALRRETVSRILGTLSDIGLTGVAPYRRHKKKHKTSPFRGTSTHSEIAGPIALDLQSAA